MPKDDALGAQNNQSEATLEANATEGGWIRPKFHELLVALVNHFAL